MKLLQSLDKCLLVFAFVAAPPVIDAKPGYAARGVVLFEEVNKTLLLTTNPCAGDAYKREVRFRFPYDKTPAGQISCGDRVYEQSIVRQR